MKIIITHASAGAGHKRCAEAIYEYIKKHCPSADIQLIDVLSKSSAFFKLTYIWGYSFLVRYLVWLWGFFFWITEVKFLRSLSRNIALFVNRTSTTKFRKFLIEQNPDFIISTHFLPSEVASRLKREDKIKSKLITVITDFGVHPFWLNAETDQYVVASELTKKELVAKGVSAGKVEVFGIPIDQKFSQSFDRTVLCQKLNLNPDSFTVLIMTGSFGVGPLEEIAELLCKDVQVLVVCAANKKLYSRLKNKNLSNVAVFGYVDNTEELMAVSDIIITKPGGLSIAEALSMELVPIFISAIPGQEEGNVRVLGEYGIGIKPKTVADVKNIILNFKNDPNELSRIKGLIRNIKKPCAEKEICNAVCKGSAGDSC